MHSLRNPKWVFLLNSLPVVLLLLLCYGEFSVIHTLLPASSVAQWKGYGLALSLMGVGAAGYAGVQLARRRPLGGWYSVAMLLGYSLWLCLLTTHDSDLLPWGAVPRWMLPTEPLLMAWAFLMPTLAHALLALVARFTPDDKPQSAAPNFLFAVATPFAWWLVFLVLSSFEQVGSGAGSVWWRDAGRLLFVAALVVSTLSFFFFLVRALFIITQRRNGFWSESSLVWKVIITVLLPLLGLGVNNGLFFGQGFRDESGIFGNFNSPWFYILAVLNGALLCLPDSPRPVLRLLQLLGRSALFGYTLYFFLVFLPFLPLSIPAIILIGTGFLLLAPTLLFVVHIRQLSEDVLVLRALYSNAVAGLVLVAGLATLPLVITADYWHRRRVLHEALAYVYTPNYAQAAHIDGPALARTLDAIRQNKSRGPSLMGAHLPYLSTYFNWLVLDNLMLSESKLDDLDRIFGSPAAFAIRPVNAFGLSTAPAPNERGAALRDLRASSRYDARQQAWVSWLHLEVANRDSATWQSEYRTAIALPPGCWVSDYILTIGNRQERGILAENRAASWVFAQIASTNRDPGLLAYRGPNDLDLRVFPVTKGEPRRTSIQLLHKEPCTLTIDGRTVVLGDSATAPPVAAPVGTAGSGVLYLSALAKQQLPLVQRRPYYHFLIDASANGVEHLASFRQRVAQQLAQPLPRAAPARFSLVNAYTTPVPAGKDWAEQLRAQPAEGGFFLTGGIRRVLFAVQQWPTPTYPVLVVVTDNLAQAVLDDDFEDFSSAYPESDVFYVLGPDGRLAAHSLRRQSGQALPTTPAPGVPAPVRAWPDAAPARAYLPAAAVADVVLGQPQAVPTPETTPASPWLTGLLLRGYGQWQSFHPETAEHERVPFVQASFRAGILTPFTSFLALENDAQKAALRRKQDETLAANASLDTLEKENQGPTAVPIDEGAVLLLVAGALLAGWQLRRTRAVASGRC